MGHSQSVAEELVNNILERQRENPKNWDIEKMMTVFKSFMKDSNPNGGLMNPSLSNYIGAGDGSMRESTFSKTKGSIAMDGTLRNTGSIQTGMHESKHKYTPELNRNSIIIDRERQNQLFNSEQMENAEPINRYELLFEYHKYLIEKRDKKKETAIQEDLRECTFKPQLISQQANSNGRHRGYPPEEIYGAQFNGHRDSSLRGSSLRGEEAGVSLYERAMMKKQQKELEAEEAEQIRQMVEEHEMEECTFKPDITASQNTNIINSRKTTKDVKGFDRTTARLRYGHDRKEADKVLNENLGSTNLQRLKDDQEEHFQSINYQSIQDDNREWSEENPIILTVDVTMSKNKTGKISIRKNDDPEELAHNFSLIYNLSSDVSSHLVEMLKEYKHQFLIRKNMVDIAEDTEEDNQVSHREEFLG